MTTLNTNENLPVAIIGIGCRFPGGADGPEEFWELLRSGKSVIREIPADRFDVAGLYTPVPAVPGKIMSRWGGFLDDIDKFDAACFGMSPREAVRLDPQQRLLLKVAWEALEDGGQSAENLSGSDTGVFVGLWLNDYEARLFNATRQTDFYMTTGTGRYAASGRISHFFGFEGPSFTIDAACASSLVAIHLACQSLRSGECSMALAGGSNVILQPQITIAYSQSKMMAPDGHCKFGDAKADGYVRSEGAGIMVLKPLAKALSDGDPIYAVILGSAANNDGKTSGSFGTPSRIGQEKLLRQAYSDAGVSPGFVHYIEAHGTGTQVGDPVELEALGSVLQLGRREGSTCLVGSVKTNLGHTEGAAGIAGLIKVALSLRHRVIPPSLHCNEPNPNIPWQALPLIVARELSPWPSEPGAGLAGVSSFGIAGTNAHVVVAERPNRTIAAAPIEDLGRAFLIPVSSHGEETLHVLANRYKEILEADSPALHDVAYTATRRRDHREHRLAIVGETRSELRERLTMMLQSRSLPDDTMNRKIVFVFPGQGSQWFGMGRELFRREPVFRDALEECERSMRPYVEWSLFEQLSLDETSPSYRLRDIDCIQPTLLAIEIALAQLWRSWGIEPDAVIGHSMGELAAACTAGALSLGDTMRVICERSKLLKRARGKGAMAVVELSIDEAQRALSGLESQLAVAVCNSPRSTVISGEPAALDQVLAKLEKQGVYCRLVRVDVASHSPQMDILKPELFGMLQDLAPKKASVPIYSTVRGTVIDGAGCDAAYWADNLREPVLFSKMTQELIAAGHGVFIEMSPNPVLLPPIEQGLQHAGQSGLLLASLRRNEPEQTIILGSLGKLYESGYSVRWERLYPTGNYVKLPRYVWQDERFWYDVAGSLTGAPSGKGMLGAKVDVAGKATHLWNSGINFEAFAFLRDHRVQGTAVLPAAALVEMSLRITEEVLGPGTYVLENIKFARAITIPEDGTKPFQAVANVDPNGAISISFFSCGADETWQLHAQGRARISAEIVLAMKPVKVSEIVSSTEPAWDSSVFYTDLAEHGLEYGASFRGIRKIWQAHGGMLAELTAPESLMDEGYLIHPATLDSAFQLLLADREDDPTTYVPVALDRFHICRRVDLQEPLWAYATRDGQAGGLTGDVCILDADGRVVAEARGLKFQALATEDRAPFEQWLYRVDWKPVPPREGDLPTGLGAWMIMGAGCDLGTSLAAELTSRGERVHVAASTPDAINLIKSGQPWKGIVHLQSLEANSPEAHEKGCLSVLHLLQALLQAALKDAPRLWLVTRGVQSAGEQSTSHVEGAPLWGLGAVIAQEHPELKCCRVDLENDSVNGTDLLMTEICQGGEDSQVTFRGGSRYVARLVRHSSDLDASKTKTMVAADDMHSLRLALDRPGTFDALSFSRSARRKPGPGEVEIRVHMAGLNFIDVMKALGIGPGFDRDEPVELGAECSGEVIAVGPGVGSTCAGDRVLLVTPSFWHSGLFSSHVIARSEDVVPLPDSLTFEKAATIPIAFLTAHYGLNYLARMKEGETVLIHSAAGGVGLAAHQLAVIAGAKVIATAGTEEKRAYLRELGVEHVLDSRSTDFADTVRTITGDRGVDIVLNSLSGDALMAGMSLLAPGGRFVEIGKRDIYENSQLGMELFKNNHAFFAVDLALGLEQNRPFFLEMLRAILAQIRSGDLQPLPSKVFPAVEAADAFRHMAHGQNIGKVVIRFADQKVPVATSRVGDLVRPDKTYWITGGLGALGLLTAQWLARKGARSLVLSGRGKASLEAQAEIRKMAADGVSVRAERTDVSNLEEVNRIVGTIQKSGPPLGGIFHAAGVLADSTLSQFDDERFLQALAPKVSGAWNLHLATRNLPLDVFVLFSSVSALLGIPGQGNYAAGNAFLDALARYRHSQELCANSIAWGPWSKVGLAAARSERGRRLGRKGLKSIPPQHGIEALEAMMSQSAPCLAVMSFDSLQWCEAHPFSKTTFFSELGDSVAAEPKGKSFKQLLLEAEPGPKRREAMEAHLCAEIAAVVQSIPSRIARNKPLKAMGFDSLLTLELRNRLERSLGIKFSPTLFWNYPTVALLATCLTEKMGVGLDEPSSTPPATAEPGLELDDLSQSQLEELLAKELSAANDLLRASE